MARYDGLIIPRSYSEYINKTDAATHVQAHQVSGVLDAEPTENSNKAVKSGGVYAALADKQPTLTFDDVPTDGSDNPVKSGGVYDALGTKQDILTFDDTPTEDSDNPVKSSGLVNSVPVDTVASDNMHAVTSNAVYENAILKADYDNLKYLGAGNATGSVTLDGKISDYSLLLVEVGLDTSNSKRTSLQTVPAKVLINRNTVNNSSVSTIFFNTTAFISFMYHYVDDTHIYIDQIAYSSSWTANGSIKFWGIK